MSNFMRPFMAVLLAVGALAQVPICNIASAEGEPTVVDGIAAVVNGEVITYSQVRALSAPQERLLRQQYTGEELAKKLTELRQLSVKDLIDRRLVIQAFKKESYEIPDHIVISEYMTSFGKRLVATATRLSKRSKRRITRWASSNKRRWKKSLWERCAVRT
jgi:hypothetical protein